MEYVYKVYPKTKRFISGILPNRKRIIEPTVVKNLSRSEFLRCIASGEVHAIVDGVEIPIMTHNYEEAKALFKESKNKKPYEKPAMVFIPTPEEQNTTTPVSDDGEDGDGEKTEEIVEEVNENKEPTETINEENNSDDEEYATSGYATIISEEGNNELPESVSVAVSTDAQPMQVKPPYNKNKHHGKHYGKNQNTQSNYSNNSRR